MSRILDRRPTYNLAMTTLLWTPNARKGSEAVRLRSIGRVCEHTR